MLELKNINVTLGSETKLARNVLQNLNLKASIGEFIIVIGSNGAGKSTMFNIISGFIKPDTGTLILNGQNITLMPQTKRAALIAKVMQDPKVGTIENMTIFENMAFALKRGASRCLVPCITQTRKKLFQEKLAKLNMGLENRLDEMVCNLSGGQRQALSLIMAVIAEAKILLLDEITAALDPKTAEIVMKLAYQIIKEQNLTCIMITHNMQHAIKYGDRMLALKDGHFMREYQKCDIITLTPALLASQFGEV